MRFEKDMTQNSSNDMTTGSHHESVRTGTKNNIYLPSQHQMIFNFFVYGSMLHSPKETKREIPTIQLDR